MKKLYIVYLPKKEKEDVKDRKILKILKWYSKNTVYTNSIITSPGYMSTTDKTIDYFISKLSTNLNVNNSNKIYYGILNGMNGHNKTLKNNIRIIDCHNQIMPNYGFIPIIINAKSVLDHRKVMCFFKHTDTNRIDELYNDLDIKEFLDNVTVNAVLIGSSNQSKKTYFDNPSDKGEADIFMFVDEEKGPLYRSIISNREENDAGFEDTVITESVYGKGDSKPEEFLKDILADLLYTNI